MRAILTVVFTLACGLVSGCAGYCDSPGADFRGLGITDGSPAPTDPAVADALGRRPESGFPTVIAAIRVQGRGYRPEGGATWDGGDSRVQVVTLRDVETQGDFDRLAKLPMVSAVVPVNGMAVPKRIESERDLRAAAGLVHADMVLLYTFNTRWNTETTIPLVGLLTLGIFPNQNARVTSTSSAALVDVRSGYVYALAESTEHQEQIANCWTSGSAVGQTRRRVERKAFEGMLGELEKDWKQVADRYAVPRGVVREYVVVPARPTWVESREVRPAVEPGWDLVPRGVVYRAR